MDYSFEYDWTSFSDEFTTTFGVTNAIFSFIVGAYMVFVMWKIFEKAGKPGWAALIPVYNTIVMFQIMGFSPWLLLLFLVPIFGWIALAIIGIVGYFRLAKYFGKSTAFGLGLLFLNIIFFSLLAFDDSVYNKID